MGIKHADTKVGGDKGYASEWNKDHVIEDNSGIGNAPTFVVAAFNSKDKGAADYVCDGTADQVEINQAITDLPASGGMVFLMEGVYTVDGQIIIDSDNITLAGVGAATIIKIVDGYDLNIQLIDLDGANYCTIKDLAINGNKANQADGIMYGIYSDQSAYINILNCWIYDLRGDGIHVWRQNNVRVEGCYIDGNTTDGIRWDQSTDGYILNNRCSNNGGDGIELAHFASDRNSIIGNNCVSNTGNGINLYEASDNRIIGNNCKWNVFGIYIHHGCIYNLIEGNNCRENSGDGIYFNHDGLVCSRHRFIGNICYGNGGCGIKAEGMGGDGVINGNHCKENVEHGIYLYNGQKDWTITGNYCDDNDNGATGNFDGICLDDDTDRNIVSSNHCRANGRDGIRITNANTSDCVIIGNYCAGNFGASITDNGTNTLPNGAVGTNNLQLDDLNYV